MRDSNRTSNRSAKRDGLGDDEFLQLPAVGAKGLPPAQCLTNDNGSAVASIGDSTP